MKVTLLEDYPFLYETHLHTKQASACARNTGYEMAAVCKEAGYTGIFVTDHNWGGNTCIDKELDWVSWMTLYAEGYKDAARFGEENDFDVYFGMEAGFLGTEFLLYGLTPEWFIKNPDFRTADIEKQYQMVHEAGGMVVQAHPFRVEPYIPVVRQFPEFADAIEGSNATHSSKLSKAHNEPTWDDEARELAKKCNLPMTAGSDVHAVNLFGGGVAFKRRLTSAKDYCDAIIRREDYVLSDGAYWRKSTGEIICPLEMK